MAGPELTPVAPADAREGDAAALQAFLDKWRARWPEWPIAEVFVPAAERPRALAWAALVQELGDAAWGGADPRPGLAKLGWWQEELRGWERGVRRHPLGLSLLRTGAPWGVLAAALDSLPGTRERPGDAAEAFDQLAPFARAAAAVEGALFGAAPGREADHGPLSAWLLLSRFTHDNDAHIPLTLLASAGSGDPRQAWTAELRQRWPGAASSSRPRRIWTALARGRLDAADPGQPLSGWSTLWRAWKAARV
ncbi:phytoene/squalene synthase family protein [Lysobacter sp. GX 14042]|uniref:phytoene/squalene synthase family protein n=1 Tax=Lysobacter sp. GX 14042 TaxID=2907155 RepID=UPI001F45D415|nr:phytoene/squalene synthase family protein [Lysobacter sp. GX 14042]MCE7032817.1 phytoene/squalene synthase family protein [Lysobacter sp. GX 14042]